MIKKANNNDNIKYETRQQKAILEAEKAKPSADPTHWAKKSCRHCYGRGVIGAIRTKIEGNTLINQLLCDCAKKNFTKWRDAWCAEYLKNEVINSVVEPAGIVDNTP